MQIKVLLVEAGGPRSLVSTVNTCVPAACGKLQHDADCDWGFYAEPQPGRACTRLVDGRSYWPRGKGLGGSSALNYMAYVRGNRADFDAWGPGWTYDEVLPVFKRSEDASGCDPALVDPAFHGMRGPLSVSTKRPVEPLAQAFVSAARSAGFRASADYNGADQLGVGLHQVGQQETRGAGPGRRCHHAPPPCRVQHTTRDGMRCSAADAFLLPILSSRKNLHVLGSATVTRVVLDGGRAVGVEVAEAGRRTRRTLRASREVVLSAGAIGSPHILMLSGIGPREHLEAAGVRCEVDAPEVGSHLQDHLWCARETRGGRPTRHARTLPPRLPPPRSALLAAPGPGQAGHRVHQRVQGGGLEPPAKRAAYARWRRGHHDDVGVRGVALPSLRTRRGQ